MARIVVGGTLVRYPLAGMNQWVLAWLVGFKQLGHDVYFVEKAGWPDACYDVAQRIMTDDCSYGIGVARTLLKPHGLDEKWCFVDIEGRFHGLGRERIAEVFKSADAFVDLEWDEWLTEAADAAVRVFIDGEPAWFQMKMENAVRAGQALPSYDFYYTGGHNIGTPRSTAPTIGRTWGKLFPPIRVDAIPFAPQTRGGPYTTVMKWQSNRPVTFDGVTYGQKDLEFPKFMDLPRLTNVPLEIAVSGKVPADMHQCLLDSGWSVRNADAVAVDLSSYWSFILSSRAEFAVNKNVFVATTSGVFPERPGCYMASGRPAIVQDTGFSEHLPCGRGLFAIRTVEEAAAAIEAIEGDYMGHATAAREIAAEFLDARKVLAKLLREIGI
jgi:hypothetical protein